MLNEDNITCPITLELLVDPVQLPCCGKTVSRQPLITIANTTRTCCFCRAQFSPGFNAQTAAPNRVLADIVEEFKNNRNNNNNTSSSPAAASTSSTPLQIDDPKAWSTCLIPIEREDDASSEEKVIAQLQITTCQKLPSEVQPSPILVLTCADQSGSMSGNPFNQVKAALRHIVGMSHDNPNVTSRLIVYNSVANEVDITTSANRRLDSVLRSIDLLNLLAVT
jgi:hypothetical protein